MIHIAAERHAICRLRRGNRVRFSDFFTFPQLNLPKRFTHYKIDFCLTPEKVLIETPIGKFLYYGGSLAQVRKMVWLSSCRRPAGRIC